MDNSEIKTNVASSIATEGGFNQSGNRVLEEKREVTYSAYGINLENTVKLLSCSKQVSLIVKNDIKTRRMFVSSSATLKE